MRKLILSIAIAIFIFSLFYFLIQEDIVSIQNKKIVDLIGKNIDDEKILESTVFSSALYRFFEIETRKIGIILDKLNLEKLIKNPENKENAGILYNFIGSNQYCSGARILDNNRVLLFSTFGDDRPGAKLQGEQYGFVNLTPEKGIVLDPILRSFVFLKQKVFKEKIYYILFYYKEDVLDRIFKDIGNIDYSGFLATTNGVIIINFPPVGIEEEQNVSELSRYIKRKISGAIRVKTREYDKTIYFKRLSPPYDDWSIALTFNTESFNVSRIGKIILIIQAIVLFSVLIYLILSLWSRRKPGIPVFGKEVEHAKLKPETGPSGGIGLIGAEEVGKKVPEPGIETTGRVEKSTYEVREEKGMEGAAGIEAGMKKDKSREVSEEIKMEEQRERMGKALPEEEKAEELSFEEIPSGESFEGLVSLEEVEELEELEEIGEAEIAESIKPLEKPEETMETGAAENIKKSEVEPIEINSGKLPEEKAELKLKKEADVEKKFSAGIEGMGEGIVEPIEIDEIPGEEKLPPLEKLVRAEKEEIPEEKHIEEPKEFVAETEEVSLGKKEKVSSERITGESQAKLARGDVIELEPEIYEKSKKEEKKDELATLIKKIEEGEEVSGTYEEIVGKILRRFVEDEKLSKCAFLKKMKDGVFITVVSCGLSAETTQKMRFNPLEKVIDRYLKRGKILHLVEDVFYSEELRDKFDHEDKIKIKQVFLIPVMNEGDLRGIIVLPLTHSEVATKSIDIARIKKLQKNVSSFV